MSHFKRSFWHRTGCARLAQIGCGASLQATNCAPGRNTYPTAMAGFKQPLERCKLLTRWAFELDDWLDRENWMWIEKGCGRDRVLKRKWLGTRGRFR